MTVHELDRRTVLKTAGATLALAVTAGCVSGDDGEPQPENGDTNGGDADEYGLEDWLDGAGGYDGVHDFTGQSEVTVKNGAGSSGMEYDPVAIVVDTGTTVRWEWTGDGGAHSVTDDDGAFDSGMEAGEGVLFEYTFDEVGTYRYYCTPHVNVGQKGAVVVE